MPDKKDRVRLVGGATRRNSLVDAIGDAIDRMDWHEARRIADESARSQSQTWEQKIHVAGKASDWAAVINFEPGAILELNLDAVENLPPPLMRLAIQARHRLELFEQARDLSRVARERMPDRPDWLRREADALFSLGAHRESLELALDAWRRKLEFAPVLVVRNFLELKDFEACGAFLRDMSALSEGSESVEAMRARILYSEAMGDYSNVAVLAGKLVDKIPEWEYWPQLADVAARKLDGDSLNQMLEMVAEWQDSRQLDLVFRRAAASILYAHYRVFADWTRVEPFLRALAERPLEPSATAISSIIMLQAGEYQFANSFVRGNLELFPSSQLLWRRHLHILSLIGVREDVAAARREMKNTFPRASYLAAMSIAEPRSWDDHELIELLEHNLDGKNVNRQIKFFSSLTEVDLPVEQLERLRGVAARTTPMVAAQFDLMLAATRDVGLLGRAVSAPVKFWEFKKSRIKIADIVQEFTAALPKQEPGAVPELYGMADCLRLTVGMQAGDRLPALFTRESFADAARLAAIIVRRIKGEVPTSVIRLGDGEGHFLQGPPVTDIYRNTDRAQIQSIWWGSMRMHGRQLDKIVSDFRTAVAKSDVLAILPPWRFIAEMHKPDYTTVHRGIHSSIYHVARMQYNGLIASMHYPNDFESWGLWDEILATCDEVSYISCHKLGSFLLEHFGVATRSAIQIPGEKQFTGLFGRSASTVDDGNMLLSRHDEVVASLQPRKGEVYLVAAGFLGKIYCDVIRRRGGIGIDIGSLADYWMGFATRRYRLEGHADVGVLNVHIDDHILADEASRSRILGDGAIVRSCQSFRYNIGGEAIESGPDDRDTAPLLLRAIGHPRCGASYLASLIRAHGVQVGHEVLLRDGIVSWTHAVRDLNVPNGHNATYRSFAHTIAYVRNPIHAIPSIVLENGRGRSLYFRRQHLLRTVGIDLADYRGPFERAVASFLLWYDVILDQGPELIVPVERADYVMGSFFAELPSLQSRNIKTTADLEAVVGNPGEREKPAFGRESYVSLNADLKLRLESFCEKFGYDRPW